MALRWFCNRSLLRGEGLSKELIDRIPGKQTDRRTPLGELNWIFTAITDTIAWNMLPRALFQKLFRQVGPRHCRAQRSSSRPWTEPVCVAPPSWVWPHHPMISSLSTSHETAGGRMTCACQALNDSEVEVSFAAPQDLMVASLFRNFLLAERIMRAANCTPVSWPKLPPTHQHPMWHAWDMAAEMCLLQLSS